MGKRSVHGKGKTAIETALSGVIGKSAANFAFLFKTSIHGAHNAPFSSQFGYF
jgi:hypothetical protein